MYSMMCMWGFSVSVVSLRTLRTSQPGETGLGPHTPSTCAGMCNQLLLLLVVSCRHDPEENHSSHLDRHSVDLTVNMLHCLCVPVIVGTIFCTYIIACMCSPDPVKCWACLSRLDDCFGPTCIRAQQHDITIARGRRDSGAETLYKKFAHKTGAHAVHYPVNKPWRGHYASCHGATTNFEHATADSLFKKEKVWLWSHVRPFALPHLVRLPRSACC